MLIHSEGFFSKVVDISSKKRNSFPFDKGIEAIMVSDALMAKGSPVGTKFLFGGNEIIIYPDESAHLVEAGNLAGSTLKINDGLRILVEEAMVPFNYAINACTINCRNVIIRIWLAAQCYRTK